MQFRSLVGELAPDGSHWECNDCTNVAVIMFTFEYGRVALCEKHEMEVLTSIVKIRNWRQQIRLEIPKISPSKDRVKVNRRMFT